MEKARRWRVHWLEEKEEEGSKDLQCELLAFVSRCHVQGVPCLLHEGSWERLQKISTPVTVHYGRSSRRQIDGLKELLSTKRN